MSICNPVTSFIPITKLDHMFEDGKQISLTYKIGLFVATRHD